MFTKKSQIIPRDALIISIDANDKIYIDIESTLDNKMALLNMLERLIVGTLQPVLVSCLSTIDDPDIRALAAKLQLHANKLNPLNIR